MSDKHSFCVILINKEENDNNNEKKKKIQEKNNLTYVPSSSSSSTTYYYFWIGLSTGVLYTTNAFMNAQNQQMKTNIKPRNNENTIKTGWPYFQMTHDFKAQFRLLTMYRFSASVVFCCFSVWILNKEN